MRRKMQEKRTVIVVWQTATSLRKNLQPEIRNYGCKATCCNLELYLSNVNTSYVVNVLSFLAHMYTTL